MHWARRWLATLTTAMALVAVGCVAGPQPEPPDDPHTPRDGGAGRGPDAPPPQPPPDPSMAIDAGAPRPAADAGVMAEPPPWLDPDEVPDSRNDGVAPFPFEPCCGWFVLPEASSDAGTDAEAEADAGADVDAGPDADADSTD